MNAWWDASLYGLKPIDLIVIVGYFAIVMVIGFWVSRQVRTEEDFFLGGRRFGKLLLVMHWLCTGTHSEQAVQVTGASARVGLGGIWYHWMYLFSTPFYWMIGPIIRRLRVITTGDFFRIRYGRSLEMVYSLVAILYLIQSIAMLLRGAGSAIAGATGGEIPTQPAIVLLAVLFSSYVVAGGLVSAAYTDALQGILIIVLSVILVPAGLQQVGGWGQVHAQLDPHMFQIAASPEHIPTDTFEGTVGFIVSVSLLALAGVVVQPHVMNATGSGKTELEARVGMCYGNFIKRLLTMAWAFTGLIAAVQFSSHWQSAENPRQASEELFGMAIREWLGDGWRGLMIACLVAGVTSAEVFMVVGAGVFTRNFYQPLMPGRAQTHYLKVGRIASVVMLVTGIAVAFYAGSVTALVLASVEVISLLGAAFWLGVCWRRANPTAAWCSFLASVSVWLLSSVQIPASAGLQVLMPLARNLVWLGEQLELRDHSKPIEILIMLAVQFGVMVVVSLVTRAQPRGELDPFFARLLTPVGEEQAAGPQHGEETAVTLGLGETRLDFEAVADNAYQGPRKYALELPRLTVVDWGGFLGAWVLVAALIGLLMWLAS